MDPVSVRGHVLLDRLTLGAYRINHDPQPSFFIHLEHPK